MFEKNINKKRNANQIVFGTSGRGKKIKLFSANEFDHSLAPVNSKITEFKIDNRDYVSMTYPYSSEDIE